ncbi:MAG: hypothetical protein KAH54_06415 [Candidatus Sabulitectum sp.]|nr:hypothetical protein [Candidatus Sabulitectum sp.]
MKLLWKTDTVQNRVFASSLLFTAALSVFIASARYSASGDTVATELLAVTLIREGNFDFNEFFDEGEEMPYSFTTSGSRIVNLYSVVTGMMNVPVFLVADAAGIDIEEKLLPLNKISMSIIAALSTVLMFHILLRRRFSIALSLLLSAVFAFGTLIWSVSARGAWQHGPSILFLCAGMLLFMSENRRTSAWAGFFFALMAVNRPINALIVMPFFVYTFFHRRKAFPVMVLTSLIPLAFLAWYSLEYWGSLLSLGQGQGAKLTNDPWLGIPGLLVSPARGLLVFTPVFVFSLLYMVKDVFVKGGNILYRYISAGFFLTLIAYTNWEMWYGGHCFGYRYLSEYIPVFILFIAEGWNRYVRPRIWTRLLFVMLLILSIYFQFLGAILFPSGFNMIPDNIDDNPGRLWQVQNTELVRLNNVFMEKISAKLQ